ACVPATPRNWSLRAKPLILLADELDQLRVGHDVLDVSDGPRLCVGLRVVDGNVDLHPSVTHAPEALGELRRVGQWSSNDVEPPLVAQPARLHDQGVALPLSSGVAIKPGLRVVVGQRSAVREDLTDAGTGLVQDDEQSGGLYKLS